MKIKSCGHLFSIKREGICRVETKAVVSTDDGRQFILDDESYDDFVKRWRGISVFDMKPGEFGAIIGSEWEGRKIIRTSDGITLLDTGVHVNFNGIVDIRVEVLKELTLKETNSCSTLSSSRF